MYRSLFLGCLVFIACGDSAKKEANSGGKDAAQAGNSDGDGSGSNTSDASKTSDAAGEGAIDPPPMLGAPTPDYEAIAEKACQMAGGECLDSSSLGPDSAFVEGIRCRPGASGMFCLRKPAQCEGFGPATCCEDVDGKKTPNGGRAGCDRGYLSCAGRIGATISSSPECADIGEPPTEAAPTKWPNAMSVQSTAAWACDQAGGKNIVGDEFVNLFETGAPICPDGYPVAFHSMGVCCVPKSACPETNPDIECCKADGTLQAKACNNGRADCPALGSGLVREVKAGTCKPYAP